MTLTPRPYQNDIIQATFEWFASNPVGNPCISLPGGLGKSLIPALFIKQVLGIWPNQRFLMITHKRTLIDQNYKQMLKHWPNAPIGIYSAGLNRKESVFPIVYGGIGSMFKKAVLFGHRDIIFVDEAHMISPKDTTMYQKFFFDMKLINPNLKIIGMTATDFREDNGSIIDGNLFHAKCYDGTSYQKFNKFIADGYMVPLVGKQTDIFVNTDNVSINHGEFNQHELESEIDKVTVSGLQEFARLAQDRKSWLLFAGGISNAEFMADCLNRMGIPTAAVHSKLDVKEQDRRMKAYANGELRALTNYGQLTTGYDDPKTDALAVFRAVRSVNLHVQIGLRGTRLFPDKINCLYADFGRNIERLGLINDPKIPTKKKTKGNGEIPIKICDNCGVYNHISARVCQSCGEAFQFQVKITKEAKATEVLRVDEDPLVESFPVGNVVYSSYQKDGNKGLKVSYTCGLRTFSEYVPITHPKGRKFALDWWRQRCSDPLPDDVEIILAGTDYLRCPVGLKVWVNNRYNGKISPKIRGYEW